MAADTREEVEAVSSVYDDDMQDAPAFDAAGRCRFRIRIRPDTAGEDAMVHASLALHVALDSSYPATAPALKVESCVGLSDEDVALLRTELDAAAAEMAGEGCLFHVLQTAKDFVNARNVPSDDCCICLCAFDQDEGFFKTSCGHCFHVPCIAHWVHDQHVQRSPSDAGEAQGEAEEAEEEGGGRGGEEEEGIEVQEAKCPICRCEIAPERIAILHDELRQLHAAHKREAALARDALAAAEEAKAREVEAKRLEDRLLRQQRERESFQVGGMEAGRDEGRQGMEGWRD